jgi:hypothetical protein
MTAARRHSGLLSLRERTSFREAEGNGGFTLLELTASSVILAGCLLVTLSALDALGAQRRAAAHRDLALAEAANIVERLSALPEAELTVEHVAGVALSEAANRLPGGQLKIDLTDAATQPPSRKLHVEVHYLLEGGQPAAPVRLTTWLYRAEGAQP